MAIFKFENDKLKQITLNKSLQWWSPVPRFTSRRLPRLPIMSSLFQRTYRLSLDWSPWRSPEGKYRSCYSCTLQRCTSFSGLMKNDHHWGNVWWVKTRLTLRGVYQKKKSLPTWKVQMHFTGLCCLDMAMYLPATKCVWLMWFPISYGNNHSTHKWDCPPSRAKDHTMLICVGFTSIPQEEGEAPTSRTPCYNYLCGSGEWCDIEWGTRHLRWRTSSRDM